MRRTVALLSISGAMLPLPAMASDFGGIFTWLGLVTVLAPFAFLNLVLFVANFSLRKYAAPRFSRIHTAVAAAPLVPWLLLAHSDLNTRDDGGELGLALLIAGLLLALACLPLLAHRRQRATHLRPSTWGLAVRLSLIVAAVAFFATPAVAHHFLTRRQAFWAAEFERLPWKTPHAVVRDALLRQDVRLVCAPGDSVGSLDCTGTDSKRFGLLMPWRIEIRAYFSDGELMSIDQSADPRPFWIDS